jgi:O-antigen/teichoic acid export membrane protein
MDVVAALQTLYVLLNAGLGSAALLVGNGLGGVVIAWVIASTVHAGTYAVLLRHRGTPFAGRVGVSDALSILRAAAPYAVQALLTVVYHRAGPLAVGWFRGERELGIYAAAHRVPEGLAFLPTALAMALFPTMARLHRESPATLGRLYLAAQGASAVILCPVAVVGIFYATELVDLVYSSRYASAGLPFMLLMAALIFTFLRASSGAVLLSGPALGTVVRHTGAVAALSVALNLALVPTRGAFGAAIATVLAEAASLLIFLRLVSSRLTIAPRAYLEAMTKPAIALTVLASVLGIGKVWAPVGALVAAPAVYILVVWRLGIVRVEDVDLMRGFLARVLWASRRRD